MRKVVTVDSKNPGISLPNWVSTDARDEECGSPTAGQAASRLGPTIKGASHGVKECATAHGEALHELYGCFGSQTTIDVYGKTIKDTQLEPGAAGILHPSGDNEALHYAQVFGYLEAGTCVRLPQPQVIAMPAPQGPADGCGWDPDEYVVWKNVPKYWTTLHMKFHTTSLYGVLKGGGLGIADDRQLRADQIEFIFRNCIPLAGGNSKVIDLGNTLQFYGLDTDGVTNFRGYVIGSTDYGVKHFDFTLPPRALDGISVSSKLSDIANTIQDKAVHT